MTIIVHARSDAAARLSARNKGTATFDGSHQQALDPSHLSKRCDDQVMSVVAAHADAFYREVLEGQRVYTVRDEDGFPAPKAASGVRSMPFWSKASRAQKVIDQVDAYRAMSIAEFSLNEWKSRWLPGLERDGLLVGINWSGTNAAGYDLSPSDVLANLLAGNGGLASEA